MNPPFSFPGVRYLVFACCAAMVVILTSGCASKEGLSDADYIKAMERQEIDDFNRTMDIR